MVYDAVKSDKGLSSDYKFREQIQSASVSIMSNIAEGFSRRSRFRVKHGMTKCSG